MTGHHSDVTANVYELYTLPMYTNAAHVIQKQQQQQQQQQQEQTTTLVLVMAGWELAAEA
jgi:hypothetical protein